MAENTGTGLQERVFEHSETEAADFEIAFAATITTIALAFPSAGSSISHYIRMLAILLLVITLIRRMAVMDDYSDEEKTLKATSAGVEAITILTVTYIISRIAEIGPENLTIVALAVVPILLITVQELLFRNFFIYFASFSYDYYTRDDILKEVAEVVAERALWLSRADIPDRLKELQYFRKFKQHTGETPLTQTLNGFLITVGIGFYSVVLYFLTLLFSGILLNAMLLFYVIYIRLIVRFWYAAYGLPTFSELQSSLFERLLYTFTYVVIVYLVFQF